MVNSFMKRHYIIPATNAQSICHLNAICAVSIHSDEGLQTGGAADKTDPNQRPF